jgi:hypothetical protein
MKKDLFILIFLLCSLSALAQVQTCPQIQFTYDATGNRTQRLLVIVPCGPDPNPSGRMATTDPVTPPMNVSVYPNPTNTTINIALSQDSLETESTLVLYDMSGKIVYSTKTSSLQSQIDVSTFDAGTYLLKITRGKKYATFNVLKN